MVMKVGNTEIGLSCKSVVHLHGAIGIRKGSQIIHLRINLDVEHSCVFQL